MIKIYREANVQVALQLNYDRFAICDNLLLKLCGLGVGSLQLAAWVLGSSD